MNERVRYLNLETIMGNPIGVCGRCKDAGRVEMLEHCPSCKGKPTLDDLVPTDPLMAIAWRDCLHWAIGHTETVEDFRAATGVKWSPARDGIGAMIDQATGADFAFIRQFVEWFNINVWGPGGMGESHEEPHQ